jgi:hypothetical protein
VGTCVFAGVHHAGQITTGRVTPPQVWLEQEYVRKAIYAVVEGFLRNTQRIVSVVVYATVTMEMAEQKMMLLRHRFHEFAYTR